MNPEMANTGVNLLAGLDVDAPAHRPTITPLATTASLL